MQRGSEQANCPWTGGAILHGADRGLTEDLARTVVSPDARHEMAKVQVPAGGHRTGERDRHGLVDQFRRASATANGGERAGLEDEVIEVCLCVACLTTEPRRCLEHGSASPYLPRSICS
jgi:hypothetical protein